MSSDKPSFLTQPVVKNVFMYRNGDPYYGGRRLVINEKKVSNFDTFLREVTGGVQAPFGAVRNIYTPQGGHRVSSMEHIVNGESYVAAGKERFKKMDYSLIGTKKKKMLPNNTGMVPQSRIIASARFLKPIKEPCLIFMVANGDVLNPPVRLLIPQRTLGQFERVLEMITEKMGLRIMGGVHSLYTFDGAVISDGNDLECGQFYVAVGREKFKKLPYSDLIFAKPATMRRFIGSKAVSLPPIYQVKKHGGPVDTDQSKSMGESSGTADSKMDSPNRGSKVQDLQAQPVKLRQRRSGLTMSLGAQDDDDGDQKEEESNEDPESNLDDSSGVPLPTDELKGENENDTEEATGADDEREDNSVCGGNEMEEENYKGEYGTTGDEEERASNGDDIRPAVNGTGERNAGEEDSGKEEQSEEEGDGSEVNNQEEGVRRDDWHEETAKDLSPETTENEEGDRQAHEEGAGKWEGDETKDRGNEVEGNEAERASDGSEEVTPLGATDLNGAQDGE